jgi:hypothetical protein
MTGTLGGDGVSVREFDLVWLVTDTATSRSAKRPFMSSSTAHTHLRVMTSISERTDNERRVTPYPLVSACPPAGRRGCGLAVPQEAEEHG